MRCILAFLLLLLASECFAQKFKPSFDVQAAAKSYLLENTNDPSKFSIVKLGEPASAQTCWYWLHRTKELEPFKGHDLNWKPFEKPGVIVYAKFRATNATGALVVTECNLLFSPKGEFEKIFPGDEVITTKKHLKPAPDFVKLFQDAAGSSSQKLKTK